MPMKRKNLHPLNLNPSKNKMSEGESGSLCGREKDFGRHIDEKTNPMADVFLSWVFLFSALDDCIEEHGMSCSAQASPFDVQLDDYTIVQPDVMVFCRDPLQVYADRATAAPDLVIEVLSKSTAFRDRHLKLFKYQRAGVREVWLVSPEKRGVEVYLFERNTEEPERYTFDDKVPVHISDGRCSIDFADIHRKLADYLS